MLPESHPLYQAEIMLLYLFEHAPQDHYVEFVSIWNDVANGNPPPDGKKIHVEATQVKDLERTFDNILADWITRENRGKRDVYFGVCPRQIIRRTKERYPQRGRNEDVTHAVCAWMDYDKMTYKAVMSDSPEPSCVVFTGHGAHFYWKYPEAVPITRAVEDSEKLKQKYGGDNTTDPARLLRIPGTRNWKEPEREVVSKLEHLSDAIFTGIKEEDGPSPSGTVRNAAQVIWEIGRKDFDLRTVILGGYTAADGRYKSLNEHGEIDRSAVDWRVMSALLEYGCNKEEIKSIFFNKEFQISEKVLDEAKRGNGEHYFEHTFEKARLEHQKRSLIYREIGDIIEFETWKDIRNAPQLQFAVDYVLPVGGMLIISGPAKSWKSFLTQELILLLAGAKGKFMGMFDVKRPVANGHVLAYCQAEITKGSLDWRLSNMAQTFGVHWEDVPVRFLNQKFDLGSPKHIHALIKGLEKIKAQYLIIDPLARFHSANENSQKEMAAILSAAEEASKKAGVLGTIIVHHHGKPVEGVERDGVHAIRGSTVIGDWGNAHILLKKKFNRFQGKKYVTVEFELRDAEEPPPISLILNKETYRLEPYDEDAANSIIVRDIVEKDSTDQEKIAELKARKSGITDKMARDILSKAKFMSKNGGGNGFMSEDPDFDGGQ
jgi:hypothetical protein